MTVFFDKARGRWRFDFQLGGQRFARECLDQQGRPVTSKRAAIDAEAEAKRQARMAPKLPRAGDLLLAQVMDALSDTWKGQPDGENKNRHAREILAYFGPDKAMRDISTADCQDFITHLSNQPLMIWTGGSGRRRDDPKAAEYWKPHPQGKLRGPGTVNRYLPVLRKAFQRAYDTRDPITRERAIDELPRVQDLKEPKRKARPVPDDVLADLRTMVPDHINDAIVLTLYFGFRRNEAFRLQIHHVDFDAGGIRLQHQEVKNCEDSFMPGSRAAMQFLAMLVDQAKARTMAGPPGPEGRKHLITWRRTYKDETRQSAAKWMPLKSPKRAWGTAMKKVMAKYGKRWRWHDIRAAYITHVAMNSGPIVAQKMARHADFDTTRGYIEVADQIARDAAEKASLRPALQLVKQ